jgi:hypothetical protein
MSVNKKMPNEIFMDKIRGGGGETKNPGRVGKNRVSQKDVYAL